MMLGRKTWKTILFHKYYVILQKGASTYDITSIMNKKDDKGEGGVKIPRNGGDVICGWPQMFYEKIIFIDR